MTRDIRIWCFFNQIRVYTGLSDILPFGEGQSSSPGNDTIKRVFSIKNSQVCFRDLVLVGNLLNSKGYLRIRSSIYGLVTT